MAGRDSGRRKRREFNFGYLDERASVDWHGSWCWYCSMPLCNCREDRRSDVPPQQAERGRLRRWTERGTSRGDNCKHTSRGHPGGQYPFIIARKAPPVPYTRFQSSLVLSSWSSTEASSSLRWDEGVPRKPEITAAQKMPATEMNGRR